MKDSINKDERTVASLNPLDCCSSFFFKWDKLWYCSIITFAFLINSIPSTVGDIPTFVLENNFRFNSSSSSLIILLKYGCDRYNDLAAIDIELCSSISIIYTKYYTFIYSSFYVNL